MYPEMTSDQVEQVVARSGAEGLCRLTPSGPRGSSRPSTAVSESVADPDFELGLAEALKASYGAGGLVELYGRFATGDGSSTR